jgi:aryl-alcohol dehydrogenase-like predicted oxidoreductase
MEYRLLGKSQLSLSRIGFGAMSLELDNPNAELLVQKAADSGINYFDTADIYQNGLNESFLGRVLRSRRHQLILATKVGNRVRPDGSGLDWVPTKKYILSSVEKSLERLQTDYIDLYQLHGGTIEDPIDDIVEAFELLKSAGKVRAYGISSIRPNVIREYVKRSSIVSVMMQYSLLDRRPEESVFPLLEINEIGVLARGAIAKGLLISKPAEPYLYYSTDQVGNMSSAFRSIVKTSPFETAVQFTLTRKPVCSAVIGIRTESQLKDALDANCFTKMSSADMNLLENVLPANKFTSHI